MMFYLLTLTDLKTHFTQYGWLYVLGVIFIILVIYCLTRKPKQKEEQTGFNRKERKAIMKGFYDSMPVKGGRPQRLEDMLKDKNALYYLTNAAITLSLYRFISDSLGVLSRSSSERRRDKQLSNLFHLFK